MEAACPCETLVTYVQDYMQSQPTRPKRLRLVKCWRQMHVRMYVCVYVRMYACNYCPEGRGAGAAGVEGKGVAICLQDSD
jgi:hypothetical protein